MRSCASVEKTIGIKLIYRNIANHELGMNIELENTYSAYVLISEQIGTTNRIRNQKNSYYLNAIRMYLLE